jgi:hypothetical protein
MVQPPTNTHHTMVKPPTNTHHTMVQPPTNTHHTMVQPPTNTHHTILSHLQIHIIPFKATAEDAYSFAAPDPTFAFVEGPCCPTLDFVIAF